MQTKYIQMNSETASIAGNRIESSPR
uniref:Uncharacterized protein n=1 Tax=Arundo donax TaxID=35708 RepID=A0A0A9BW91_ARUDO